MPKKTKEPDNTLEIIKNYLLSPIKKNKSKSKTKKEPLKKDTKTVKNSKEKVSKSNQSKVALTKNDLDLKTQSKNLNTKKVEVKKEVLSSNISKPISKKEAPKKSFAPEYYDLPFKYNKTVVKILAQTPNNLFVYWEISDDDRTKLKEQFGEYFFEITKPVLIIHNLTMNYSFEIDINDFANSWYFKVNDSDCNYKVELGRRPISINYSYMPKYDVEKQGPIEPIQTPYIYISSSNNLQAPNDHILFNNKNKIYFKNVKTNQIIEKDIKDFPFIVKDGKFVSTNKLYEELYKDDLSNERFDMLNPSSRTSGSW